MNDTSAGSYWRHELDNRESLRRELMCRTSLFQSVESCKMRVKNRSRKPAAVVVATIFVSRTSLSVWRGTSVSLAWITTDCLAWIIVDCLAWIITVSLAWIITDSLAWITSKHSEQQDQATIAQTPEASDMDYYE